MSVEGDGCRSNPPSDPHVSISQGVTKKIALRLEELHKRNFASFWSAEDILNFANSDNVIVLLYKNKSKVDLNSAQNIDAFALMSCALDTAELLTICVDPIQHRKSIAFLLLLNGITFIKGIGVSEVFLEVSVQNQAAIGLYTKLGFVKVGHRKAYYSDGSAAIVMKKNV